MNALTFQNTAFDVIDRAGQPWLRGAQVALSIGYKNPDNAIKDLYIRNADEFTDSMTALVEMDTAGGKQQVRIFSLRGAHLLGMFARTAKAAEFRRWVLDVLERETTPAMPAPRGAYPALNERVYGLTPNEYTADQAATLVQHLIADAGKSAAIPPTRIALYTASIALLQNAIDCLRDESTKLKQGMERGLV